MKISKLLPVAMVFSMAAGFAQAQLQAQTKFETADRFGSFAGSSAITAPALFFPLLTNASDEYLGLAFGGSATLNFTSVASPFLLVNFASSGGQVNVELTGPGGNVGGVQSFNGPLTPLNPSFTSTTDANLLTVADPLDTDSFSYFFGLGGAPLAAGAYTLKFSSAFGATVDDVSVTAVPEPSSYAMMLAGLGALGFVARRRKTRKEAFSACSIGRALRGRFSLRPTNLGWLWSSVRARHTRLSRHS